MNLPEVYLKKVQHKYKIGDQCPAIEPNVHESCILVDEEDGVVGLFLNNLPDDLRNLATIADTELRSDRVPKSRMDRKRLVGHDKNGKNIYKIISQWSAILGSVPPNATMRRNWPGRSHIHRTKKADTFVKAMFKTGAKTMDMVKELVPTVVDSHVAAVQKRLPDTWRFTPYFSSTISNCNIAAPIHQDNANIKGTVNFIITKRQNSTGGNLYVPDYDACFNQQNNSLLVYPAWRNMHGVTPIEETHNGGYRNSHVWYALDKFYGK